MYKIHESIENYKDYKNSGIIKPYTNSKRTTPIIPVVKPNGKICLFGDLKATLSKFLKVEKYPLLKIKDMLTTLGGDVHLQKFI